MGRSSFCRSSGAEKHARFAGVFTPVTALLDFAGAPAALWSEDRSVFLPNSAAADLFGSIHGAPLDDATLWRARIDPADRQRFAEFCEAVRAGGRRSICRYRFTPLGLDAAIDLQETAERLDPPRAAPVIVSRYAANGECRRLAHQIGNQLQAARGELDLLRLSGALPERAAAAVLQPLEAVHELLQKIGRSLP